MTKEEHTCDNVNCNHNDTKGLCCLYNPNNCLYRQLQKENAELKGLNNELLEECRLFKEQIAELQGEIRQLKNEVEDLRGYCNQIGKVKTDVLKAFEHIVAK